MTKNILDTISVEEESPQSSFIVEKKINTKNPEEKKKNKSKIKETDAKEINKPNKERNKPWSQKKKEKSKEIDINTDIATEPLWLSVSEAAKTGGVEQKTIRRAIQSEHIKFKIINNRYLIEFASMVKYLSSNTKLKNKFLNYGIGQYVEKWK